MITTVNCQSSFRFPPQHTLRARGVCSRIPHPRRISRDSHGLFFAHVYLLHIISLSPFYILYTANDKTGVSSCFQALIHEAAILVVLRFHMPIYKIFLLPVETPKPKSAIILQQLRLGDRIDAQPFGSDKFSHMP